MQVSFGYLDRKFSPNGPIGKKILLGIAQEMRRGAYTLGPAVQACEERWAALCGVRYAVGVGNGTDALELALEAMGVGPEKTVATVPQTFPATVNAIIRQGATPLLVDIEPWGALMPPGVSLVCDADYYMPVHWAGDVALPLVDMDRLIEDAAQSMGGIAADGRMPGSLGRAAGFSLHPQKNINALGDGGMVTTDDEGIAEYIRSVRNHGLKGRDIVERIGRNSRLDTINAIAVLAELDHHAWAVGQRNANAARYKEAFTGYPIRYPHQRGQQHGYHLFQVLLDSRETRDALKAHLQAAGIDAPIHYPIPIHMQPAYKDYVWYGAGKFPNTERFVATTLTLPVNEYVTDAELAYVIAHVRALFDGR